MADRYSRSRYNRSRRFENAPYGERDERSWRQQEQFYTGDRDWGSDDHDERFGRQMSDPYERGSYAGRGPGYEGRDNERYGGGPGYSRGAREYAATGEHNYGPSYVDTSSGPGFGSFTSEDQPGRDFTTPKTGRRGYGGYGGGISSGGGGYGYGAASRHQYDQPDNERGFFDRASDEVASWFGDEDAARRREMDHTGRGPAGYTRSDERILEDASDELTDDWAVDARNIQVTVQDGEITLDGTVPSRDQKRRAEDCVEDISGVRHVQNNLRVQEQSDWDESTRGEGQKTGGSLT